MLNLTLAQRIHYQKSNYLNCPDKCALYMVYAAHLLIYINSFVRR